MKFIGALILLVLVGSILFYMALCVGLFIGDYKETYKEECYDFMHK